MEGTNVKVNRDELVEKVKGHMKDTIHGFKGSSLTEKAKRVVSLLEDGTKWLLIKTERHDKNLAKSMDLDSGELHTRGKVITGVFTVLLVLLICKVGYVPLNMGLSRYHVSHYVNENGYTIEDVINDAYFPGNDADYSYSSNLSGDIVTVTAVHPKGKRYGELTLVFSKSEYKGNEYWRCNLVKGNVEGKVVLDYGVHAMFDSNLFLGKDGTL